jgi:hypothetical protein
MSDKSQSMAYDLCAECRHFRHLHHKNFAMVTLSVVVRSSKEGRRNQTYRNK